MKSTRMPSSQRVVPWLCCSRGDLSASKESWIRWIPGCETAPTGSKGPQYELRNPNPYKYKQDSHYNVNVTARIAESALISRFSVVSL